MPPKKTPWELSVSLILNEATDPEQKLRILSNLPDIGKPLLMPLL